MTLVAVSGMTIGPSNPLVVATITITGSPSAKVKAGGAGVYENGLQVSVSNIMVPSAGATIPDPGPYSASFTAGSQKVKADGKLVLLNGDQTGTINANPQIPGSPNTPFPVAFMIQITVPGQTKVKAA